MFREQLHTAFDNISPSPELLDRVSAMMSEEVNKKKAPLKLNVVKYGGIAAALVLAAGGTFLVLNNQNGGIKTSETANTKIVAGATENFAADEKKASQDSYSAQSEEAYYAAAESTTAESVMPVTTSAVEVQTERAGEETKSMGIVPFSTTAMAYDVPEAEENFEANIAGNASDAPTEMKNTADEKRADNAAEIEAVPVVDGENFDDACASDSATVDSCENTIPIVPSAMKPDEEAEKEARCEDDSVSPAGDSADEVPADDDADVGNGNGGAPAAAPTAEEDAVTESAADPATGMLCTDPFLDLRTWSLTIPDQLYDLADGLRTVSDDGEVVFGEKWSEYVHAVMSANKPTTIEDELNIYTFMKYFNIPVEDARKALYNAADTKTGVPGITLTREEADIILTMDIEKITAAFANPYAIVKGTAIYSPKWLLEHSFDDYRAAGITKDDIREKYGLISTMADNFSDAVIGKDAQTALNKKLDEYLK